MSSNLKPSSDVEPKHMSKNAIIKASGYTGMQHMMQSYGLKTHEEDDIAEAGAILDGFRQIMQAQWEEKHAAPQG